MIQDERKSDSRPTKLKCDILLGLLRVCGRKAYMCSDRQVAAAVRKRRVQQVRRFPWPNLPACHATTPAAALPRSPGSKWPQLGAGRSPASPRTRHPRVDEGCPGAFLRPKQVSCSRRHLGRRRRGVADAGRRRSAAGNLSARSCSKAPVTGSASSAAN